MSVESSESSDPRTDLITGVVVASVTPTTLDYEVDFDRFRDQLEFIVDGGIQTGTGVLMAAGGGGEGYFLNDEEWRTLIDILADVAGDRVGTMAGVFELNALHAIDKIEYAEEQGIDFVQLAPPHYEMPSDAEVYEFYRMASEASDGIGIIIYHTYWAVPDFYEITPPLMADLADLENIVGTKFAAIESNNLLGTIAELRDRDDFAYIDNEGMVETLRANPGEIADAFMGWIGNYDPAKAVELAEYFQAGDYDTFVDAKAQDSAMNAAVYEALFEETHGRTEGVSRTLGEGSGGKAKMEVVGRPIGPPWPPQHQVSPDAIERIREQFPDLRAAEPLEPPV